MSVLFDALDTDPHPRFRVYSSGNLAEVAPERLSVMSWSLVGTPMERATRGLVERLWPRATWHSGSHYTFVGYFAARPYHNLAAYSHLATQIPLLRLEDVAELYFEDEIAAAPPQRRPSRLDRLPLGWRMTREYGELRGRLVEVDERLTRVEQAAREALEQDGGLRLGAVLPVARDVLGDAWDVHIANTAALAPLHAIQRAAARRSVKAWSEIEASVNRPEELVWPWLYELRAAGASFDAGDFLGAAFYEIADAHEPFASFARHAPSPAAPARAQRADGAAGRASELRSTLWRMLSLPQRVVPRTFSRAIADTMSAREESKSLVMRSLHVFRRLVPAVAAARGVPVGDWPYLTIEELWDAPDVAALADAVEARREQWSRATGVALPSPLDLGSTDLAGAVHADAPPAARRQHGRGISPGGAVGVAVTRGAFDAAADGDARILVCDAADADVEPLLSQVAGVVSAHGSVLSHISILVRERGLPGVVGHPLARDVRPGQWLRIDGSAGEVELLEGPR